MRKSHQRSADTGNSEHALAGTTNIPTDLLRTFVTICELGSFTKTAHLLNLTQPAVSAHIRRLESLMDADLIEKSLNGVVLTECGTDVLRHARRMLAINDQIVSGAGGEAQPRVLRVGIPNIHAPIMLAKVLREGAAISGDYRLQVRCDHSGALLRSVSSGYLELAAAQFVNKTDPANVLACWSDELVWVRWPDFVHDPGAPVPMISSPNLFLPDRLGMAALEAANRRYEIAFTAFDTTARWTAAAAGLGYVVIPRSAVTDAMVIEAPGVLPELPPVTMGIVARDDLDTAALTPLVATIERLFTVTA